MTVEKKAGELLRKGVELLKEGETLRALNCFEKSLEIEDTVLCRSYVGLLNALERGKFKEAMTLCEDAIGKEPDNPALYLNLGKVLLKMGRRADGIETIRKGLGFGQNEEASRILEALGTRKTPVFSFLPRGSSLNKYAGILLKKLGMR
jgi:tetratricopeptide (TPR) repeat protein